MNNVVHEFSTDTYAKDIDELLLTILDVLLIEEDE